MNEKGKWVKHSGKCEANAWLFVAPDGKILRKVREFSHGIWTHNGTDMYISAEAAMQAADKEA